MDKELVKLAYRRGYEAVLQKLAGPRPEERQQVQRIWNRNPGVMQQPKASLRDSVQGAMDVVSLPFAGLADGLGHLTSSQYKGTPNLDSILDKYKQPQPSVAAPAAPAPDPAPAPVRPSPSPVPVSGPSPVSAQDLIQQNQRDYAKQLLRGVVQWNQDGTKPIYDNNNASFQKIRQLRAQRPEMMRDLLRQAHKDLYNKDEGYTAWYNNWKAQRAARPAPTPTPDPAPTHTPAPAQDQPKLVPMTRVPRYVRAYKNRPENRGGVIRRFLHRNDPARYIEVPYPGEINPNEAVVW